MYARITSSPFSCERPDQGYNVASEDNSAILQSVQVTAEGEGECHKLTIMYSRMESEEAEALDSVKEADCCRERCRTLTWPAKGQVQATLQ